MGFQSIRFFNFRNLKDRELAIGSREVFLIGENGQGKTNMIEAIYLLCVASSFRESPLPSLLRDPNTDMGISGRYIDAEIGERTLSMKVSPGSKKEIRIDGKPIAERRDLLGHVLCICFVQQDMDFVNGPPEARRRFLDQTMLLADLSLISTIREYKNVLRSRNFVLKSQQGELLDTYDRQLAPLGIEITTRRAALIREFNSVFSPLFREIMGWDVPMAINYRPSWPELSTPRQIEDFLALRRGKDLALGSTTCGPHRDDFIYTSARGNFTPFASTGQVRLCALILRVAQARYLTDRTGRKPVLLLDDVLLELDPPKKRAFIALFPSYEQVFFTFLPDENYLRYRRDDTLILTVKEGEFIA